MSNLAKLKKKAAEFEQKRQFDKALGAYEEVLKAQEGGEDADVSLYNRVGDLQLRMGRPADALQSYERAVDLYAERGFLNNAIALCNKILRQSPSAAHIHYKLGRVNALKGFRSDARQHFLTYAELMQRGGRLDEAFAALKEFADLSPGQEDLRLLLADQFARHDRVPEALEQLQVVLDRFETDRRHAEAQIVRERMRALDPEYAELRGSHGDEAFDGVRASGASTATGRAGDARAMPELVLIDPTEYGTRSGDDASRAQARPAPPESVSQESGAPAPAAEADVVPTRDRRSGGVSMPDGMIRGAEEALSAPVAADAESFAAEPYRVADLEIETTSLAAAHGVAALPDRGDEELQVMHGSGVADAPGAGVASDAPGGSGDFVLMPAMDAAEADPTRSHDAFGEDDLLIDVAPVTDREDEPRSSSTAAAIAEGGLDTAAFGAALDAGWAEAEPLAEATLDASSLDGEATDGPSLDLVMPEAPPADVEAGDNPIAGFDSWLASPASLAVPPAAGTPVAQHADAPRAPEAPRAWAPVVPPAVARPETTPRAEPKTPVSTRPVTPADEAPADASEFVNLGDWLREDELPRSTRMVVEERAPSGDEEADFAAMLRKFKQGVAENVDDADYDSHYDLGVAYKEMGLTEEAIAEFQRALRGTERRARTYEALGQCFLDLGQPSVASSLLQRATQEPGMDDQQLVGVLYLLGRAAEMTNHGSDAVRYYERVLAVDITFSDVAERIGALEQVTR